MPAIDPDDLPKKKITHEMGQDLSLLSVGELAERIGLLKEEIATSRSGNGQKARLAIGGGCIFQKVNALVWTVLRCERNKPRKMTR